MLRASAPALVPAVAAARGARVLVVDDNDDSVSMMAELIRHHGYVVEIACDGPAALATLERFASRRADHPRHRPPRDGRLRGQQRIRALPAHKTTTMIALTGYGQRSDFERSRSAGFDRHFVKPVQVEQLLGSLASL